MFRGAGLRVPVEMVHRWYGGCFSCTAFRLFEVQMREKEKRDSSWWVAKVWMDILLLGDDL